MKQKRGISPLIAAILLIGFTVVLATVFIVWGQNWFGGLTETTEETTAKSLACINEGGLSITRVCISGLDTLVSVQNTGTQTYALGDVTISADTGDSDSTSGALAPGATEQLTLSGVNLAQNNIISSIYSFTSPTAGTVDCTGPEKKLLTNPVDC